MIKIRHAQDRGHSQNSWLNSYHSFSFAEYFDPAQMGHGSLRVINEDMVQPGQGFATHPHHDMEIITYVIAGQLSHRDSMGTGSVISPGEIQIMSAGSGITHSEFNQSATELVHLLQIWIVPEQKGLKPTYQQKKIIKKNDQLILIGSGNGRENSVVINQNSDVYVAYLNEGQQIKHNFANGRQGWLQVIKGLVNLNGLPLEAGDGAAISDEDTIILKGVTVAEFLLFDLL